MLSKKTLGFLLKFFIVAFAVFFLFDQLNAKSSINQLNHDEILSRIRNNYSILLIVVLMMLLNWFLESLKWRFLISKVEDISVLRSIRAIFSGITVSAFTPNRIGEYGGRVFCLDYADRIQAVLITVIGSMAQLITTIIFGSIGLIFLPLYSSEFFKMIEVIDFAYPIMIFLFVLLDILLIIVFFNVSLFSNMLSKISFLHKYDKYIKVFSFYNTSDLSKVILYSIARYVVFTTQFFILLILFNVNVNYFDAIILIMTMLLVISVIPSIAITEIGIRGSVAIFLFGLVSSNTSGILSAAFFMWLINLLLPALIGTVFIFTLKFFRK